MILEFKVPSMVCDVCRGNITQSIQIIDTEAIGETHSKIKLVNGDGKVSESRICKVICVGENLLPDALV